MQKKNGYNRKQILKKERAIMVVSSVFVLTALTLTGVYVKQKNMVEQYDGYTVDFSSLENNVEDKFDEIQMKTENMEENLQSVDSTDVEIPGLTDRKTHVSQQEESIFDTIENKELIEEVEFSEMDDSILEELIEPEITQEAIPEVETHPALEYQESNGLTSPVSGEILIEYNMEGTVYFETLDQYKCNSAVILKAEEGADVCAAASGQVIYVFEDSEIGTAVSVDLGNGYVLTYGQLDNVNVIAGSYLTEGEKFATVAKPTKYYSLEGSNLYFKMTKNGEPMNPMSLVATE